MPQQNQQIKLRGLGMFAASMIWGTWVLVLKDISLPGFFITITTSFTGFLGLLVFIFATGRKKSFLSIIKIPDLLKLIAGVAFLEAIQNAFYMAALLLAIKDGGSVFIPLIISFKGIVTPIIQILIAKKEFSPRYFLYGAISTIGAVLIFSWNGLNTGGRISYLALFFVIASVVISSFQYIAQRVMALKMVSFRQAETIIITYQTLLSSIFLLPLIIGYLLLHTGILVNSNIPAQLTYIAFFGLTHVALAFILRLNALKHITAQQGVIIGYLEPVTSISLSIIFLKETINIGYIIGSVLILASSLAAALYSTSSKNTLIPTKKT